MSARKRPTGQVTPCQMLQIATSISNSSVLLGVVSGEGASTTTKTTTTFTDGAIEGLRVSHHTFLQRVAEELAKQDKDVVSQNDVFAALDEMGLSELAQEAVGFCEQKTTPTGGAPAAGGKPKKRKKMKSKVKWSKEMEEEQEKLLAQSKEAMKQAQGI